LYLTRFIEEENAMTMLLLRLSRFPATFCAIMLCLGTASLYALPLTLEGSLSASASTAFHPRFDLRTAAFSISGPGTEIDRSHLIHEPGFDDAGGGTVPVGGLKTLNTAYQLATIELSGAQVVEIVYGTIRFSTEAFLVPPPSSSVPVTGIPFTASGTLLGHDVVGTGFASAILFPAPGSVFAVDYQFTSTVIPEPGTMLLLASGLALGAWWRWRSSACRHRASG
jgi:hypothetical protein